MAFIGRLAKINHACQVHCRVWKRKKMHTKNLTVNDLNMTNRFGEGLRTRQIRDNGNLPARALSVTGNVE